MSKKNLIQTESNISDDAHCAKYFIKYNRRARCPFCGSIMHFRSHVYYEGRDEYWTCPECGLTCPNWEDFTEEQKAKARGIWRNVLKKEVVDHENGLAYYQRKLKLWGKYMTDEEKVVLLAEELEGKPEHSN